MKIYTKVKNIVLITIALTIILIVGCIFIFGCSEDPYPVKNSVTLVGNYFGGITTLAAAYIAAQLFNDWRLQHNHNSLKEVATNIYILYLSLNVKLVAINDVFTKSLNINKISHANYNTASIADDVESKVGEIGDLMVALIHQIDFLQKLNDDNEEVLDDMHDLLIDYMSIMDITYYRNLANHVSFAEDESELRVRLATLQDGFENYLKKFMVLKSE